METNIALKIAYAALALFVVFNYGLILTSTVARIIARVQGRIGIRIFQPYMDIIKNNAKRSSISHGVMFYLGPIMRLVGGIGTFLFIPVLYGSEIFSNFSLSGDVLLVLYFIFFGQLGMALGAGQGGHPYSPMGVSRGLAQMTGFEVPFTLAIIALAVQYDTLSITEIVAAQQGSILNWNIFANPLATIAALVAFVGMSGHNPFSVVTAPQEVPIGPPTEYHSNFLGMLQTNRSIFNSAKLVLYMNLFFGGATNLPIMVVKTFLIYMINVVFGVAFPRFRVDQSVRFFLGIPTIIGLLGLLVAVW